MLKDTFYKVLSSESQVSSVKATLELNRGHDIFRGHFPSVPVVPGVCMMQMAKELLQQETGKKLTLNSAGILKFLAVINPEVHPVVDIEVKYTGQEDGSVRAETVISSGELIFL
jgi:3-hydroxyacyl-[acyl-carrier-protein] dehydratase